MPRYTSEVDMTKQKAAAGRYAGPTPRPGVYRLSLQSAKIEPNSSGTPMWTIYFQIDHDEGKRAQYNGALVSWTNNLNKQGAQYLAQFIEASGLPAAGFNKVVTDANGVVTKIGGKTIAGTVVKALVFIDPYKGQLYAKVRSFFEDDGEYPALGAAVKIDADDDDDDYDDDTDEDYEDDDDAEADDDDTEDDDDDDGDEDDADDEDGDDDDADEDDDDDDGDDEDAPAPSRSSRARKAAPAKRVAKAAPAKKAPAKRAPAKKAPASSRGRKPW